MEQRSVWQSYGEKEFDSVEKLFKDFYTMVENQFQR